MKPESRTRSSCRSKLLLLSKTQRHCSSSLQSSPRKYNSRGTDQSETDCVCRAIPNGVVNSFSTVIIRDMVSPGPESLSQKLTCVKGFSTTRTTELKSVGDAVQIIALIIGGAVTLNVPNCQPPRSPPSPKMSSHVSHSSPLNCNSSKYSLCSSSRLHGLPPALEHLGPSRQFLARERTIRRFYHLAHYSVLEHGWIYASFNG